MRIPSSRRRDGFTLIEMLVTIGLALVLLGLAVLILPSNDQRQVARGADSLQGWLSLAKQRAIRDQAPRGYRLIADPGNPNFYTSLQAIEMPDIVKVPVGVTITISSPSMATGKLKDFYNQLVTVTMTGFDASQSNVVGSDYFSMLTTDSGTHIVSGPAVAVPGGCQFSMSVRAKTDEPVGGSPPTSIAGNFFFYRSAQPTVGESPLQLPDGVGIDEFKSVNFSGDILFGRNGQMRDAQGGRVVLWVRHFKDVGEPTLMTIYTRSGGIAAHPPGPPGDELKFTADGLDSGL